MGANADETMNIDLDLGKFPEEGERLATLFKYMNREAKRLAETLGTFEKLDISIGRDEKGKLDALLGTITLINKATKEIGTIKVSMPNRSKGMLTGGTETDPEPGLLIEGAKFSKQKVKPGVVNKSELSEQEQLIAAVNVLRNLKDKSDQKDQARAVAKDAADAKDLQNAIAAANVLNNLKNKSDQKDQARSAAKDAAETKDLQDAISAANVLRNIRDKSDKQDQERSAAKDAAEAKDLQDAIAAANVLRNIRDKSDKQDEVRSAARDAARDKTPVGITEKFADKSKDIEANRITELKANMASFHAKENAIKTNSNLEMSLIKQRSDQEALSVKNDLTIDRQTSDFLLGKIRESYNLQKSESDEKLRTDLVNNKTVHIAKQNSIDNEKNAELKSLEDARLIEIENIVGIDAIKAEVDAKRARIFASRRADEAQMAKDQAAKEAGAKSTVQGVNKGLDGIKTDFTEQGILNIARANKSLQEFINTTSISQTRVKQIFGDILKGNTAAIAKFSKEEQDLEVKLRSLQSAYSGAADKGEKFNKILLTMGGMVRLVQVQLMHQAISGVIDSFKSAKDRYLELEAGIALINTISQKATRSTEAWTSSLVGLSNSYGIDILDATAAAYEAVSNQIAQGAAITPFLAQSFEFARATATSAKDSVNLLSSALNAYNMGSQSTERVASILFKTIELGRIKASDMANTFGNTAKMSSSLGVSLEELGAGLATITIGGVLPSTSMTLMNNIMLKLLKPTEAMKGLLSEWGVTSGEAAVATFGFGGVLKKLNEEFNSGGLTRLGELEGDLRAIRAAAGLTANGAFDNFNSNLSKMSQGLGEYREAVRLTADTLAFKLNVEMQKLNNTFISVVGKRFNEGILETNTAIGGLSETFGQVGLGVVNTLGVFTEFGAVVGRILAPLDRLNGGLASTIPAFAVMFATVRGINPLISRGAGAWNHYSQQMGVLNNIAPDSVSLMNRLRIGLLGNSAGAVAASTSTNVLTISQIRASVATGTLSAADGALAIAELEAAAAAGVLGIALNVALIGVPLLIGGIVYYFQAAAEEQRRLAKVSEDTIQQHSENLAKIAAENAFLIDQRSQQFAASLNKQSQYLNLFVSVFRQGMLSINKNFKDLNGEIPTKAYTDSIVGVDGPAKLQMMADRVKELSENTKQLTLRQNFEDAEKSLKSLTEMLTDFKKEQDGIIKNADKKILSLKTERDTKKFDDKLSGMTDPAKVQLLTTKVAQLRKEAQTLFNNKEFEEGNAKLEEAGKFAEKVVSISESMNKGKGKSQGGKLVDQVYDDKIAAQKRRRKEAMDITNGADPNGQVKAIENEISRQKAFNEKLTETLALKERLIALESAEGQKQKLAQEKAQNAGSKVSGDLQSVIDNFKSVDTRTPDQKVRGDLAESIRGSGGGDATANAAADALQYDLSASQRNYQDKLTELKKLNDELNTQLNQKGSGFSQSNVKSIEDKIEAKLQEFRNLVGVMQREGEINTDTISGGQTLRSRLSQAGQSSVAAREANKELEAINANRAAINAELQRTIDGMNGPLKQLADTVGGRFPELFRQATETMKSPILSLHDEVSRFLETVNKIPRSVALQVDGVSGKPNALGGLQGYASGGFLRGRTGRDNQLIRAHEGEFMVNREAASRFTPELVAMNSGYSSPQGFNNGGPITNVGGVTVNATVNKGGGIQDLVALGRGLEREINRGTINLNRRK